MTVRAPCWRGCVWPPGYITAYRLVRTARRGLPSHSPSASHPAEFQPAFNVQPGQTLPVLYLDRCDEGASASPSGRDGGGGPGLGGGERTVRPMTWGLVPAYASVSPSSPYNFFSMFNARSER